MLALKLQSKVFSLTLMAILMPFAFFVFPSKAHAMPQFPATPCEGTFAETVDTPLFGLEDGTRTFTYGPDNNSFITTNGNSVNFHFNILFAPFPPMLSVIVFLGYDENCELVLSTGLHENDLIAFSENVLNLDVNNSKILGNDKSLRTLSYPGGPVRYVEFFVTTEQAPDQGFGSYVPVIDLANYINIPDFSPHNPVLIVPGILGTQLFDSGEFIWPDLFRMTFDDQFLIDHLRLNDQGFSVNSLETGDVIRNMSVTIVPMLLTYNLDIFNGLIDKMKGEGYIEGSDLFVFPYDWLIDIETLAHSLDSKVSQIKLLTGADKVDIVAHSMGGLVAKNYLSIRGKEDIDKLIFLGTPHLGAPKAGKTLLRGDNFDIPVLGSDTMKTLALNTPTVYQLLPNREYFNETFGYILPTSGVALDYDQTKQFMLESGMNEFLYNNAEEFFSKSLQEFDFSGVDAYNIAGCTSPTQMAYRFSNTRDVIGTPWGVGDKTVPLVSADYINVPASHKYYAKNIEHSGMPSANGVRQLVTDILLNQTIKLPNNLSDSPSFCKIKGKTMIWRSPVAVHIYDNLGNHTGPLDNHIIEEGILGVDYELLDGETFIYLPTDEGQIYNVVADGLKQGTFDLILSENDSGITGNSFIFDNIQITSSSKIEFSVSTSSTDNKIQVDVNGTNNFETLDADAQETGEEIFDDEAPEFQVKFDTTKNDFFFTAVDDVDQDPEIFCSQKECVAEDWAGNTSKLIFQKFTLGDIHTLRPKSILYNGIKIEILDSILIVNYKESKKKIQNYSQSYIAKNMELQRIQYNTKKDQSTLMIIQQGIDKQILEGKALLQLETDEGTINVSIIQ